MDEKEEEEEEYKKQNDTSKSHTGGGGGMDSLACIRNCPININVAIIRTFLSFGHQEES